MFQKKWGKGFWYSVHFDHLWNVNCWCLHKSFASRHLYSFYAILEQEYRSFPQSMTLGVQSPGIPKLPLLSSCLCFLLLQECCIQVGLRSSSLLELPLSCSGTMYWESESIFTSKNCLYLFPLLLPSSASETKWLTSSRTNKRMLIGSSIPVAFHGKELLLL